MQNPASPPNNVLLLGGIILDRYFEVENYPAAGQDALIRNSYDRVGGCALNVAVTLKNLGTIPYIVNRISNDEIGDKIDRYVQSLALHTDCMLTVPGRQTGYCLNILDKSGERTFLTFKGCEEQFALDDFSPVKDLKFSFAYITGYYLLNRQTASAVIQLAKQLQKTGCQIVFDPGPLVAKMEPGQLRELLHYTDWIIPNSAELTLIQNTLGIEGDILTWLLGQGVQKLALKKGSQGVDIITPASNFSAPGFPVNPIDTTGAGDSFAGGFIHGLANGYSLSEATTLANACGAFTTLIDGPHGHFSIADIQNFLATFKENNS